MKRARKTACLLFAALSACATPMTQIGSVSREQVMAEQFKEQQLAIQAMVSDQRRIDDVSFGLLKAAVPLCPDALRTRMGITVINRSALDDSYIEAARALGYTDTLELESVARGSAAERVGLHWRDRLLAVNGEPLPLHGDSRAEFSKRVDAVRSSVALTYIRDSVVRTVAVPRDTVCDYDIIPTKDPALGMNAVSTGKQIFVSTSLMRFTADDDELAIVIGHEIGHSAMHHIDAKKQNAVLGALAGAIVDIAFAKQGVNTGGRYSSDFAKLGAVAFSQDFEREADYVGLNIAAAAGRDVNAAPRFWRRMGQDNPTGITFASSHPTTAERYVRLDQWGKEIDRQVVAGQGLRLAMKDGSQSAPLTVSKRAPTDFTSGSPKVLAQGAPATPAVTQATTSAGSNGQVAGLTGSTRAPTNSSPVMKAPDRAAPAPTKPASRVPQADNSVAVAVIGAPSSDSARAAAVTEFAIGRAYFDRHEWGRAEIAFKHTLQLDGSLANYHAALGSVEMVLQKWEEAEAEYTAASMIDLSNQEYRAQILEARRRRHP